MRILVLVYIIGLSVDISLEIENRDLFATQKGKFFLFPLSASRSHDCAELTFANSKKKRNVSFFSVLSRILKFLLSFREL